MITVRNHAKERLEAGELALGVGLRQARTVDIAEIMKTAGYDFLFIDMEHNSITQLGILLPFDCRVAPVLHCFMANARKLYSTWPDCLVLTLTWSMTAIAGWRSLSPSARARQLPAYRDRPQYQADGHKYCTSP
jgi:hypothetical protein